MSAELLQEAVALLDEAAGIITELVAQKANTEQQKDMSKKAESFTEKMASSLGRSSAILNQQDDFSSVSFCKVASETEPDTSTMSAEEKFMIKEAELKDLGIV